MKKVTNAKKVKADAKKSADNSSRKSLEAIVEMINKKHGEGAISLGVPNEVAYKVEFIPTGSLSLDVALGGGIPRGRYTQIAGQISSTKTSMSAHTVANAQKMGLRCAWFDVEGTSDEEYFKACGIDYNNLLYSRPDGSEEAFDMILTLQKTGEVDLAVLDSTAALSPNKEQEKESLEDNMRMGITQQLMGEFFRKYQANNNRLNREGKYGFTLICINQLREKIGAYGDPFYAPGGNAKDFSMTCDIRLRRGDWIAEGKGEDKSIVGQVVKFNILKNKVSVRAKTGEYDFYLDNNQAGVPPLCVDTFKEIILLGVEYEIIDKSGAWFKYKDMKFQGIPAIVNAFKEDEDMFNEVREEVLLISRGAR